MAVTVANIITNLDSYIGDSSTDRVSQAERFQYITESVAWLQERLGNDHQNATYDLKYFDGVHYYKTTTAIADLLDAADLRRGTNDHDVSFTRKSPRELAEEIGQDFPESSYSIERRDMDAYLVVNHRSKYDAIQISNCDYLADGGGEWEIDSVNSDATNLTVDNTEFTNGTNSFMFDIDVSQSGNNRATILNSTLTVRDLSSVKYLASGFVDVYIPDSTNITSLTLYWGSDSSNYYSKTSTTDYNGQAFQDGWNTVKFDWATATKTSSPDDTAIDYVRIDINYGVGQTDDSGFRIDNVRFVRPEKLTFHYLSWVVGKNSSGTDIYAFTATTDVPYFSGQYDQYKYPVAHRAASLAYKGLRLYNEADSEETEAEKALNRISKLIPSSRTPEVKSFKIMGVNFSKGRNRRFRR